MSKMDREILRKNLQTDCKNCFGLCCAALCFSASEGFPTNKEAGQPCINLQSDFKCSVHTNLAERGLKGCIAFDCFGAGQKVSQISFGGNDWRKVPESAKTMFEVFLIVSRLQELLWYLTEALTFEVSRLIYNDLRSTIEATEQLTYLSVEELLKLDIPVHRAKVDTLLQKTSELVRTEASGGKQKISLRRKKVLGRGLDLIGADLRKRDMRGENLRGAYLIAADLRDVDLSGADLIGADFRDADLRGANLSKSIFLTQAQINAAKGNADTKIPSSLSRPMHWG
ncbi:pentapeptide repeat-containing protein [Desulfitobacterium sp. AusDCA]|uniref:pentapeptide repeat-containing protein n=1 Tax=Desulfitobacterium sp. AusDCA TaxID=3240383 RepID=UPI003DA73E8A